MTHIELVRKTVTDLGGDLEKTADLFYQRLFELDPSLRPLFQSDLQSQQTKFLDTLLFIINELDTLETIKQLGSRHQYYGVQEAHYQTAAVALIWALEQSLGDAFTNEVRIAWQQIYYQLISLMKDTRAP